MPLQRLCPGTVVNARKENNANVGRVCEYYASGAANSKLVAVIVDNEHLVMSVARHQIQCQL